MKRGVLRRFLAVMLAVLITLTSSPISLSAFADTGDLDNSAESQEKSRKLK